MAKIGIPSFLLDCHTNDNIAEIEAEYGVKGFAVVVRLWQKIYSEKGYYCEWIDKSPLLFLSNWFGENSGVTINLIEHIVSRCLKNGIFDAKMYENYSILTSARIQTQYFDVVKRRGSILVKKEYLLVSVAKIEGIVYINQENVCENQENVCKNQENVCKNNTSKVKVKEREVKERKDKDRVCARESKAVQHLEEFLAAYPKCCNRHLVEVAYVDLIMSGLETEENIVVCAKNYAESCKIQETPEKYIKNAENFLTQFAFEKYLPGKYKKPVSQKPKNKFANFPQREYSEHDYAVFEQLLLNKISNPN